MLLASWQVLHRCGTLHWWLADHYTGCPKRNVPDFGRVFLMLKYTDITQNTYVQSWTVTEIKAREKCGLLVVPRTVPGSRDVIPIRCALSGLVYSRLKRVPRCECTCKVLGNPKDNYDMSASVFVVQFNPLPALTYQTVLDLNAACRSKRTETYWLFSSQIYYVVRTKQ